jgi:hypothetical protein
MGIADGHRSPALFWRVQATGFTLQREAGDISPQPLSAEQHAAGSKANLLDRMRLFTLFSMVIGSCHAMNTLLF